MVVTYSFKVESRNSYGYSAYSDSITLLCAFKPDAPITIVTTNTADKVMISWSSPVTNGSPITSYKIFIQQHSSMTFTQEQVECDGTLQTVVDNRLCHVSLATLKAAPYSLVKAESVYVKVISVDQNMNLTKNIQKNPLTYCCCFPLNGTYFQVNEVSMPTEEHY